MSVRRRERESIFSKSQSSKTFLTKSREKQKNKNKNISKENYEITRILT